MKDPAFLFYSNDFYSGTRTMLPKERACYLDLMIYQHQYGVIPFEIDRVAMFCSGIDEATLKAVLEAKFKRAENGWYNERLAYEIKKREEYAATQSKNGVIGQFWKKVKASFTNKKEYEKYRKNFLEVSKDTLYDLINLYNNQSFTSFQAMLEAMLKHLENENEDEDIYNSNIDNRDIGGMGGKEKEDRKTWREDYQVYLDELRDAFKKLVKDPEFIAERQRYHPGLDIRLSLEKACKDYWSLPAGWKKKKSTKTETIDWKATLRNALDMKSNQVWKTKEQMKNETEQRKQPTIVD